ncbi:HAD family hydrolase [Prevotella sp. AGR2160]|uniref:HAD family hydrolase n=1 Tax=Prevotella sp. AGR2160 TaxID=1280674 RepID=UPI0004904833|nr:HAD family phosphatase [Prevotella sp. AGR2160]
MIRNIWFDMGGVIFDQNTEEAFRRFREAGIDTDYYMGAYGQRDFFMDLESGKISAEEFCSRMSEAVGRKVSYEEAAHCWLGFFDGVSERKLTALDALRKHYHLGLLSNTNPFMMAFTRSDHFSGSGRPITDFFDSFFCSYEMKCCKPDAEIYQRALAADHISPGETLFVDDSKKNTDAAAKLGINVLQVSTNEDWTVRLPKLLAASK